MASVFVDKPVSQEPASHVGGFFMLPATSLLGLLLLPLAGEII